MIIRPYRASHRSANRRRSTLSTTPSLFRVGGRAPGRDRFVEGPDQDREVVVVNGAVAVEIAGPGETSVEANLAVTVADEEVPIAVLGADPACAGVVIPAEAGRPVPVQ